jgi:hypothetical protein
MDCEEEAKKGQKLKRPLRPDYILDTFSLISPMYW